jgi:iron complex transport system substrate-binding protein
MRTTRKFEIKRAISCAIIMLSLFISATVFAVNATDFTLGIYGNANMDDTINEQDVIYVQDVIQESKAATNLSDANYDGKIDEKDVDQIKKIIEGNEKEITVLDSAGKTVTVKEPVERVVIAVSGGASAAAILNVKEKVVGVPDYIVKQEDWGSVPLYPEFAGLPSIGKHSDPDVEAIISLNPDFVMLYRDTLLGGSDPSVPLKNAGIAAVYLDLWNSSIMAEEMQKLGYIFGKSAEADKYVEFCDKYENYFENRTKGLTDADKPKVYLEDYDDYYACGDGGYYDRLCKLAGGKNIAAGLKTDEWGFLTIDKEFVMEENPDIIIKTLYSGVGYSLDNRTLMNETREKILGRTELNAPAISAVKNKQCYLHGGFEQLGQHILTTAYFAKWIHPELFTDLDPQAVHQEYLDTFFKDANFNVSEHGTFVYPPMAS